jgi:hypothetical protein
MIPSMPLTTATPLIGSTPIDEELTHRVSDRYHDWYRLYEADATACPLAHPEVVLTDLEQAPPAITKPVLIHALSEARCVGIGALVPKTVSSKRIGAFPVGWKLAGHRLPGNGFLLEEPDDQLTQQLLTAALQMVQSTGSQFLLIEDLDDASPIARLLEEQCLSGWTVYRHADRQPRRRIQLPETCEQYWQKFSSKTRQTFRRKLKKFGTTKLERFTDPADVPRFLEAANRISLQTWQTRQFGLRVRNDAAAIAQATRLAELGLWRSYLWCVEEQPVAFTVGNQDHGVFHYEEVGYLPEYAKFSPGQMMLIQMIDDLITHQPAAWFDFGGGDADYKELFANQSSQSGTVWLFPPTLAGRTTQTHLTWSLSARQWVRRQIADQGWTTHFRQWVRRGNTKPTTTTDTEPTDTP